ncbi:MAG: ATP-binding protein [Mariprofundaceae bacterium]
MIDGGTKRPLKREMQMTALISMVDDIKHLRNNNLNPEEKKNILSHLSDEVASLAKSYEETHKSHELIERQFLQAQKMEAIGTLVGGIAHDFNNILAGMINNLYLVKQKVKDNPDALRNIASIEQLSFRGADLINQLLTFARKDRVTMKPLLLIPFIKETLKLLRSSLPESIEIHHNICKNSLRISGDETQIHQMLMNLFNNARDVLHGRDSPRITVRLKAFHADDKFVKKHSHFKAGYYARLSVEDNGSGIPEDHIEHLFEPFFTTKEVGKGTGLGLSMVFGAVKTHAGFVEVESIEGNGATFHIYLPLLENKETAPKPLPEDTVAGHGEMILLVDDDVHILESGKEVLEALGYTVLRAMNGLDAVDTFITHQNDIALIIMDLVMPKLGGVLAVERIRKISPDVKVIYSTGYDKEGSLPGQIPLGDAVILSKPYNVEELSKTIRDQLNL